MSDQDDLQYLNDKILLLIFCDFHLVSKKKQTFIYKLFTLHLVYFSVVSVIIVFACMMWPT